MTTILKITCGDETRRILLDETPDFDCLDNMIRRVWPDCKASMTKYANSKGEHCPLDKESLADFLASASKDGGNRGYKALKLYVPAGLTVASQYPSADKLVSRSVPSTSAADETEMESPRSESSWHRLDWEAGSNGDVAVDDSGNIEDDWVEATNLATDGADLLLDSTCESASSGATEEAIPASEEQAARRIQRALLRYHQRKTDSTRLQAQNAAGTQQQVDAMERVYLILAAFDGNDDEHLNFDENNDLQQAAWGGCMAADVYRQLCSDFGENPEIGLGAEALFGIYAELGTLDRDFEAARRRLEGPSPASLDTVGIRGAAPAASADPRHWSFGMRVAPLSAAVTALSAARRS